MTPARFTALLSWSADFGTHLLIVLTTASPTERTAECRYMKVVPESTMEEEGSEGNESATTPLSVVLGQGGEVGEEDRGRAPGSSCARRASAGCCPQGARAMTRY